MKTKLQRQREAIDRKLKNLDKRKTRLLDYVRWHHEDITNSWSRLRLAQELKNFHRYLREIDEPSLDHSFVIYRNAVLLVQRDLNLIRVGGAPGYLCVYCKAPCGAPHVDEACGAGVVSTTDAVYKDTDYAL